MAHTTKIQMTDGEERDALEMDFEIQSECWNEYRLQDGSRVRVKVSAHKIYRLLDSDGQPAHTAEGDPMIWVRYGTDIVSSE